MGWLPIHVGHAEGKAIWVTGIHPSTWLWMMTENKKL